MNIIGWAILIETGAIALLIAAVVGLAKRNFKTTEKLKVARLQIASLEAIYNQLNEIQEKTAEKLARLSDVDACINYLNGGGEKKCRR